MIYDKRKLKRYDIFLIVEFKPLRSRGGFSIGITRDLSPDGFSLESQTIECQCGDILEFRLKHPDAEWTVDMSGEVIWRNHSWYKYVIGIKFLELSEEQNKKILKLMSSVRDDSKISDLNDKNIPGSTHSSEKEKHTDAILSIGSIANRLAATRATKANPVSLKGVEHCELTGTERTFIAGDIVGISIAEGAEEIKPARDQDNSDKSFEAAFIKDKAPNPEPAHVPVDDKAADKTTRTDIIEEADKKKYSVHLSTNHRQDTVQIPSFNIGPAENIRKKKLWLYVPFAMVIIIILAIALPVMIEKFNHSSVDSIPLLTESTDNPVVEKDRDIYASYNEGISDNSLNGPSGPSALLQTKSQDAVPKEKDKSTNIRQASSIEDSTGILPPKPITVTEMKSKKSEDSAPPAGIKKIIKNTPQMNNANIFKPETAAAAKPFRDNTEKSKKIDLIAKIDETFKDLQAMQNEKTSGPEAAIETEKTAKVKPLSKAKEQPAPSQVVKIEETPASSAIARSEMVPEVKPLVKVKEQPVPSQVVKIEETPAAASITGSEMVPGFEQEKAREAKKVDIKKTERSVKRLKMPNVALLVKRDKSRTNINNSPAASGVNTADLIKNWKHIGSTPSGVPLFIAPDNISHPYEHVVNLMVKASVNKKDFVDLVAINCSQIKLRILEERNGNNPAFSSYSNEWKNIMPDSMILYDSACREIK